MSATKFLRENAYRFSDRKGLIRACIESGVPYKSAHNAFSDIQRSKNPIEFAILKFDTIPEACPPKGYYDETMNKKNGQ